MYWTKIKFYKLLLLENKYIITTCKNILNQDKHTTVKIVLKSSTLL